ncbi:Alkaline-phosphatase-like, core domain [Phytophthora cactorum]|nr:Alkaline-phosphatase-like, core domain [Phytophthora cactorum]
MVSSAALSVEASVREDKFSAMDTRDDLKSRWFKPRQLLQTVQYSTFWSLRWLGWAFIYVTMLLFFFVDRCVGLSALIQMYGTDKDHTLVWSLERWVSTLEASSDSMTLQTFIKWKRQRVIRRGVTFVTSWLLFVATAAPFVVDIMLVRLRSMRFTFEIVSMAIAESDMVSSVAISNSEYKEAYVTGTILVLVATFFASVRTWTSWADLTRWNPTHTILHLELEHDSSSSSDSYDDVNELLLENGKLVQYAQTTPQIAATVSATTLLIFASTILAISQASSPLIANVAMDTTINELFVRALKVTGVGFVPLVADGTIEDASVYIHPTENYSLSADDSLYRLTTGFGDVAFNWAKRGVAFSNLWSSWKTSRSLASLLFAQIPYDSTQTTDTVGAEGVELAGMPQFFKKKGHVEYEARPTWYTESDKPDFSVLYDGEEYAENVKNYLEMRYFTDMELGKFMDRMETAGVLNDTIVLLWSHGQAPEFGNDTREARCFLYSRAGALIVKGDSVIRWLKMKTLLSSTTCSTLLQTSRVYQWMDSSRMALVVSQTQRHFWRACSVQQNPAVKNWSSEVMNDYVTIEARTRYFSIIP